MFTNRRLIPVLVALVLASLAATARADQSQLDLRAWQLLPVLHDGRIMPLDTFARTNVAAICGRERPTLGLEGFLPPEELKRPEYAAAGQLFPDGPRRFDPSELLLSWLATPERWEDVPFLEAAHEQLRSELLEVATLDQASGQRYTHVSPRQVAEADLFWQRVAKLGEEQRAATAAGKEFTPAGVDAKVNDLFQAYTTYLRLTARPTNPQGDRLAYQEQLREAVTQWAPLRDELSIDLLKDTFGADLTQGQQSLEQLIQLTTSGHFTVEQAEPHLVAFRQATAQLAEKVAKQRAAAQAHPPNWSEEQIRNVRQIFASMSVRSAELAQTAYQLHLALYSEQMPLYLAPALNGPALERGRDTADKSQPWLNLPTLLYAPPAVTSGFPDTQVQYPAATLDSVRRAYAKLATAYAAGPHHYAEVGPAAEELSTALATLGTEVEPLRTKLTISERDDPLLAYTQYPSPGATYAEVHYNALQPFRSSWIIALGAIAAFSLSFGKLRRPMFWGGVGLLILAVVWTAYGFSLRVAITGWAPVTNMYETVVYVPWVIALLALWFAFLPAIWPGLKAAWRATAVPGTWEAQSLSQDQTQIFAAGTWTKVNWLLLLPRVALMALIFWMLAMAPYAAGERTILRLTPEIATGQMFPGAADFMTWVVSLGVLASSVWYVPRIVLAGLVAVLTIPLTIRHASVPVMPPVYARKAILFSGTVVACFLWMVAWWTPVLDKGFSPLQPVLRDNFWLLIHVLTIVSSYAAGALAWGLGCLAMAYFAFGSYRPGAAGSTAMRPPKETDSLCGFAYKAIQVAVLLLAAGTLLGGLWADVSWGRFWGWDPKEVWALISLLVYLAILHGRYAGLFGNFGLAVGTIMGFSAIAFSWYGVNFVLGVGLHSYGFGNGGQWWVFGFVLANWVLLVLPAALRYSKLTLIPNSREQQAKLAAELTAANDQPGAEHDHDTKLEDTEQPVA